MDDALDEVLDMMNLPLGTLIWIFSETTLSSTGLDMAKVEENIFEFAISLLGATIQDSGMRESSNVYIYPYRHVFFSISCIT